MVDKLCDDPSEDHCSGSDGHSTLDAAGMTVKPGAPVFAGHGSGVPPVASLRPSLAGRLEGATRSAHLRRRIHTSLVPGSVLLATTARASDGPEGSA